MSHRSLFLAIGIVVLLAGAGVVTLVVLLRHEPNFYLRSAIPPGDHRQKRSAEFVTTFAQLINGVVNTRQWRERFTDEQINSYFEEDFVKEHHAEKPLPDGISEPRVVFETDRIRLAFRYGKGPWSTVISMDVRAWLVTKEPNVVALEFQALHAGALPVSRQSWMERICEAARQHDIEPSVYRHDGHPVLLLRFQADRSNPTFQLQEFKPHPGMLVVSGRSLDSAPHAEVSAAAPGN
jgi:hypothetical protein